VWDQNLGDHEFEDDGEMETAVTRWLITQRHGMIKTGERKARPTIFTRHGIYSIRA
jgi:hypothetical protein